MTARTWQRIPGETTKDWIVSPQGHRIPLGGDVDKILVYLNALERRAALLEEASEAGYVDHIGACQGKYGGDCLCGFDAFTELAWVTR